MYVSRFVPLLIILMIHIGESITSNYYSTLGVSNTASEKEITRAYRKLAQKYHPDKNLEDKGHAEEKFKKVRNYDSYFKENSFNVWNLIDFACL